MSAVASAPRASIMIGTPSYREALAVNYFVSVLNASNWLPEHNVQISAYVHHGEPILHFARNAIVAKFLSRPEATHLLFVDDDVGFGWQQILRILDFDQDFVGGLVPRRREEAGASGVDAGIRVNATPEIVDGFISVDWVGTGFMMLKRGAIIQMIAAYPELNYLARPDALTEISDIRPNLFEPVVRENGHPLSEDLSFCLRWKELGGKIWADGVSRHSHLVRVLKTSTTAPGEDLIGSSFRGAAAAADQAA